VRPVPTSELRWTCPPRAVKSAIKADAAAEAREAEALAKAIPDPAKRRRQTSRRRLEGQPPASLDELVGQERAVEAVALGLGTEAPGFHVFVCGQRGTGREALVRAALERFQPPLPRPRDRLYVANFERPDRPRLLTLPRGKGRRFRRDLDDTLAVLRRAIPAAINHETHAARCERVRRRHDQQATRLIDDLAAELRVDGLIVGPIPEGFGTPELRVEVDDSDPLLLRTVERRLEAKELRRTAALKARLADYPEALEQLERVSGEARAASRRGTMLLRKLDARVARSVAQGFADDLARAYPTDPVRRWLETFLEEVGRKVELFLEQHRLRDEEGDNNRDERRPELDGLAAFRANLFVDAMERPAPPILFEPNPTSANLLGPLEPSEVPADHLRLRSGSLQQANGGVLVVDAGELFQDPSAWRGLKRAVKSGWIEVQSAGSTTPGSSLRPEPIRTTFKLVAIGSSGLHAHLVECEPEFAEVFKVKVGLEPEVPRSDASVDAVAGGLLRLARRSGLARPDAGAVARLLEHAAREAGRKDRLAIGFSELAEVLREADQLAPRPKRGKARIKAPHVEQALTNRRRRHDVFERRIQADFDDRITLLEVDGARVGVINGLVVYDTGDHDFGRPARITAAAGMGRQGLVDVERQARFSGNTHHKGVSIVAGLLRERFAQDKPLCLTATLAFEQSYDIVDGDSASLAESLAVISTLAGVPLSQAWGVTGSLNQKGEVQAVGGTNQKVEGFFDLCAARGLTGRQGVVLPESNVRELMVRHDVIEAVKAGRFHVVAVSQLESALALLTGEDPAEVMSRADAKLLDYAKAARSFGGQS
jgi:ATP-dependent Lon protease